ncbi:DNA repair protein RAD14 [Sporobolomyces koalae]|uniref:DNA repair protein RAD14 n=1 Tax=Sporobolomyces koalae TaxID=500713 RepID=UPI00317D237C
MSTSGQGGSSSLTPTQLQQLQENRLKAKAAFQARERSQQAQSRQYTNEHNKRPLQVLPASNTSPTAPTTRHVPRLATPSTSSSRALQEAIATSEHFQGKQKDAPAAPLKNMIGSYVEYDLSTLKNSRGGFLLQGEEDDPKRKRELELQLQLKQKRLDNARVQNQLRGSAMSIDPKENPQCKHCQTRDLDEQLRNVFGVMVCTQCKKDRPDEYSLLTKTECKEDYLLTEPELKDTELMPHLLRPNPHRPTYSNMMLFLRCQVEAYAFSDKKWGSPENLDAEFEKREAEKRVKKNKKFENKLKELRKKTKTNVWHKREDDKHVHVFEDVEGSGVQKCATCGVEVEVESF